MAYKVLSGDPLGRKIEKHLSREIDQFYIEQGFASQCDIAIRNDFFAALNLSGFKISSIGKRDSERSDSREHGSSF
jgi:hypothetical protein